jgi:hypothetical protein
MDSSDPASASAPASRPSRIPLATAILVATLGLAAIALALFAERRALEVWWVAHRLDRTKKSRARFETKRPNRSVPRGGGGEVLDPARVETFLQLAPSEKADAAPGLRIEREWRGREVVEQLLRGLAPVP